MKNSTIYAFLIGFFETLQHGSGCGMTHPTNQSWNDAYDRGMTLAEKLTGNFEG